MKLPALVGPAELAHMLGVSRQRVTQITAHPTFPKPAYEFVMGKAWLTDEVKAWAAARNREIRE